MNGDWQGHGLGAATAFEQTNDKLLPLSFEQQAQRCRRGLFGTACRTKNEQQRTTGLGSKLQAAKRRCLGVGQPDNDGADAIGGE